MTFEIGNFTFCRNIDRAASWRVWLNGIFIGNIHTDAIARALRASRQHHA